MLKGFFEKVKQGLHKTKEFFGAKIKGIFAVFRNLDDHVIDEIEEALLSADVGVDATSKLVDKLRRSYKEGKIRTSDKALEFLKTELKAMLRQEVQGIRIGQKPTVVLVVGVNGTGKTTSIAKLAKQLKEGGKKVLICASDTFRAAAIDQLAIWAERVGADIVKHQANADPAAVCFDAADAAVARAIDVLIVDTAGRLQTKENLMRELEKIGKVLSKKIPGAPHEVLLVLDATTGQNAVSQAEHFKQVVPLTGIFLSKLDGTAKGGIVIAIKEGLGLPVKYVGTGENPEDVAVFDPNQFIDALFEE